MGTEGLLVTNSSDIVCHVRFRTLRYHSGPKVKSILDGVSWAGTSIKPVPIPRDAYYLFITYIVTSNPKRISVAVGLVHIMILLRLCTYRTFILITKESIST